MVRIVDFSPSSQAANLAALKERRASLDQAMVDNLKPQEMRSPWQGAAQLAQSAMLGLRQGNIARQEASSREELSKILAGIGPEGPTMEQAAAAGMIDSDLGKSLLEGAIAARRADTEYQRGRTDKLEDRGAEWGHEAEVDTREAGQEAAINTRELEETKDAETRAAETKRIEEERKAKAGAQRMVTGDEAKALGGDPTRTYRVSADGTTLEDATPKPETTYGAPITGDAAKALDLDPSGTWQQSSDGQWKDISKSGVGLNTVAGVKAVNDTRTTVVSANNTLANLDEAEKLLPLVLPGGVLGKTAAEIAAMAGTEHWAPEELQKRIEATQRYNQIMSGEATAQMVEQMKGSTSYQELSHYLSVYNTPNAAPRVKLDALRNMRRIFQSARDEGNQQLINFGSEPVPSPVVTADPAAPAAAPAAPEQDYQEGTTATGPNGEKIVLKNGQWVPQ